MAVCVPQIHIDAERLRRIRVYVDCATELGHVKFKCRTSNDESFRATCFYTNSGTFRLRIK